MKLRHPILALCALLFGSLPSPLPAVEAVQLEPMLYVFRDSDFNHIDVGGERLAAPGRWAAFAAPVTLAFDQQILVLRGTDAIWNGGGRVPAQFSALANPKIVARIGQAAAVRCVLPVQYLEKAADGSLQVRAIARDSPDVPHYQMTLTAQTGKGVSDWSVTCQLDIAAITGREKIPGVELEVGRPILARFKEERQFAAHTGEWAGQLVRNPGGSDYSVLLLLKVAPESGGPLPASTKVPGGTEAKSASARLEISGYSIEPPGGRGWVQTKGTEGVGFENRIDADTSAHAWFSVARAPVFPDRQDFLKFVKQAMKEKTTTFHYESAKDDFAEHERNGLWLVECGLSQDDMAPLDHQGMHSDRVARTRILYATDPANPGRIAVVWYEWSGVTFRLFDEARFNVEASSYLGSLQL